jgi:hypothetical protein
MGQFSEKTKRFQRGEITQLSDQSTDPDRLALRESSYDLMLFLDAMLFYLRIQADTFARLVKYFYKAANILPGDFSGQLTWFEKRPGVDRGYASILNQIASGLID